MNEPYGNYGLLSSPFGTRKMLKFTDGGKDAAGHPSDHFGIIEVYGAVAFLVIFMIFFDDAAAQLIDNSLRNRNSESANHT